MNTIEQELEQAFLKLPTLKHVGMALLQFVCGIRNTTRVQKDAGGVFRLDFVAFSFPEGEERIRMHVNVEIEKINELDMRWLRLEAEKGFPVCEIKRASQLGQAVRYIELANDKYLTTRQTPSESPWRN
jgi:hypothetical protein